MADMDMSHSLSSLPPLGDPPTMDLDLSLTSTYTTTPAGSPLSTTVVCIVLTAFKIFLKSTFFHFIYSLQNQELLLVNTFYYSNFASFSLCIDLKLFNSCLET